MENEKFIISEDVANDQIKKLLDWYGACREDFISQDEAESGGAWFDKIQAKLVRAIREGILEVKEEPDKDGGTTLNIYQTLTRPVPGVDSVICYREVTGKAKLAMRGDKIGQIGRMYQYLGGLTALGDSVFHKLRGRDGSISECLGYLFLQV